MRERLLSRNKVDAKIYIGAITIATLSACGGNSDPENDGTPIYDIDGDGLIEIYTLDDLNDIRNYSGGRVTLYGEETGCPKSGCSGYELAQDLDFDSNQDGLLDSDDLFWNEGKGWLPIEMSVTNPSSNNEDSIFRFEGNNFSIKNLYINRPENSGGLFFFLINANISNLHFNGDLGRIIGGSSVGSISGILSNSSVSRCSSTIDIQAKSLAGGLVGSALNTDMEESFFMGSVEVETRYAGGLIGTAQNSDIFSSFAIGSIHAGNKYAGGLTAGDNGGLPGGVIINSFSAGMVSATEGNAGGLASNAERIENSYSIAMMTGAAPIGGLTSISGSPDSASYWLDTSSNSDNSIGEALTIEELACFTELAANESCGAENHFNEWLNVLNSENQKLWDFGLNDELPGLNIQGVIYRPE